MTDLLNANNKKLLLVTDAYGQVNGVARTWNETIRTLKSFGDKVEVVHPGLFKKLPVTIYPGVDLTKPSRKVFAALDHVFKNFQPDSVHIATPEGPLGLMARSFFKKKNIEYTTSYHTDIPGFVKARSFLSLFTSFAKIYERHIHRGSQAVLAPTQSVVDELKAKCIDNVVLWNRGVNLTDFNFLSPDDKNAVRKELGLSNRRNPLWLNVGRVSHEKNLEAFLSLDLPGTKIIVGDGPYKEKLEKLYSKEIKEGKIIFAGEKRGEELKKWYSIADVFVFPSHFDTFGLVNIEALASGLPVAGFNVRGPRDIFSVPQEKQVGFLDSNLRFACLSAYNALQKGNIKPEDCRAFVEKNYTWESATKILKDNLVNLNEDLELRIKADPKVHEEIELSHPENTKSARVFSFSDIHVSTFSCDLPYHNHVNKFTAQLRRINQDVKKSDTKFRHDTLVLNGDIFDTLESYIWEYGKLPTTSQGRLRNLNLVLKLFEKMANEHPKLFQQLKAFLKNSRNSEIIYITGNHDHLFKIVPELRKMFVDYILGEDMQDQKHRIKFADTLEVPSMGLRLEHGHRIDKYDYSENGEINWGDYLSLVKINIVRHIIERLNKLKTTDQARNELLNKYITRIMKVEYIRDAKLFPIYLEKIALLAKENLGELGKDIHDAIMQSSEDMIDFLRKTPFITNAEPFIPDYLLKNKIFRKFFMAIVNYIYKEQTHKNSIQLVEAVKIHQENPRTLCVSMGHTHQAGQDDKLVYESKDRIQRVVAVNSGTYIPVKFGSVTKKGVEFKRTLHPKGGVIFKADFDPQRIKQNVKIHPISGADSDYNFYIPKQA